MKNPEIQNSFKASRITNHLYLGDRNDVNDIESLSKNNIIRILNVANDVIIPEIISNNTNFIIKKMSMKDIYYYPPDDYVDETLKFIDEGVDFIYQGIKNKENILVHCKQGKSRSATIVLAYLMKYGDYYNIYNDVCDQLDSEQRKETKITLNIAFLYIKKRRECVKPNGSFIEALYRYEESLSFI